MKIKAILVYPQIIVLALMLVIGNSGLSFFMRVGYIQDQFTLVLLKLDTKLPFAKQSIFPNPLRGNYSSLTTHMKLIARNRLDVNGTKNTSDLMSDAY